MRIILLFVLNAGLSFALGLAVAAALGPEIYGRFAIGMTVAVVLSTGCFDWLRLSATRFYGESRRESEPDLRASLNAAYVVIMAILALALALALLSGATFGLGAGLLAAAVFCGVAVGLFEFQTALARARFHDRSYAIVIAVRAVASLGLGVGTALLVKNAAIVLAATTIGTVLAVAAVARPLHDKQATLRLASFARLKGFAAYGVPVVAANVVFQLVVLANRSVAAGLFGYAEAGRLSLATDLGLRLFLAVGAAVDVFVFQLAVRREAEGGQRAAAAQLRLNAVIVLAVLLLLAVGYAVAMPAFEALVVPERYRGPFGTLSLILLPGVVLFCIGQFAISPMFQISGRTWPVVVAAIATLAADALGLWIVPRDAGVTGVAIVHSCSLAIGAVTILGLAVRTIEGLVWDADFARVVLAAALTGAALWPLRTVQPAWLALPLMGCAGAGVFGGALFCLDVAGLRSTRNVLRWLMPRRAVQSL